jgi:hypothetical protein
MSTSTEEPACRCNRFDHEHDEGCPAYYAEEDEPGTPTDDEAWRLAAQWVRIRSSRDIRRELVRHTALGVPKYHPAPEQVYMAKVDRERLEAWVREQMAELYHGGELTDGRKAVLAVQVGRSLDWPDDDMDDWIKHARALCEASGWPSQTQGAPPC